MGALFSAICCCTSCATTAGSCCCAVGKGANGLGRNAAKGSYAAILGFGTLFAWIGQRYFEGLNAQVGQLDFKCVAPDDDNGLCSDDGFVFRVSFMMVCFFAFMFLCNIPFPTMSGERRFAPILGDNFDRGCWAFKLLLFIVLLCLTPLLSSEFFDDPNNGYAWTARIISAFFILFQILTLIDAGIRWNYAWVSRAYDGDYDGEELTGKWWLAGVIISALVLYGLAFGGLVVLFLFYGDCPGGLPFVIFTTIVTTIFAFPLTLAREQLIGEPGAVLPSGVVALYVVFLLWSALESRPEPECRPLDDGGDLVIFTGIMFATVTLVWTSYMATSRSQHLIGGGNDDAIVSNDSGGIYSVGVGHDGKEILARDDAGRNESAEEETGEDKPWLFQLFMITGAFYAAMLLTNWGVEEIDGTGVITNEAIGNVSFWVKIVSQWLSMGLYTWILIAPRVLPDREWDF
mmetsp:Transcript_8787/g.15454  ORF Transcript_8787/g.15454 Transcript_8787/m.15454 type:complete len:460 (+) Transcript_8787:184-1563(+)